MTKANFSACLDIVLRHEGGYVDHPRDPGGATNLGITRKTLAEWRGVSPWWQLAKDEVKGLGVEEAKAIYRARYWDRIAGDELPKGLDLAVFDFAVNSGPVRAVATLQAVLKVRRDGIAGPITLGAAKALAAEGGTKELIRAICDQRLGFLRALSTFAVFGTGWTRRVADTRTQALAMRPVSETIPSQPKGQWTMDFLSGYKTYIVGVLMVVTAIAEIAGVNLPGLEGQSAMQLLMEGLAVIFLRKGVKTDGTAA